jgi:NADH-quinone oxidoreductase subunit G
VTGHIGRPNNGLLPVWPHNNTQGAWDMGLRPDLLPGYQPAAEPGHDAGEMLAPGALKALFIAGADPAGDDPTHAAALEALDCLVVSELFLTATAQLADVVLPAQAFSEREGSYTNGARHVQRFYPAVPPPGEARPDWAICAALGARLGLELPSISAAQVMDRIAQSVPLYAGMRYPELSRYAEQYPDVGGEDLYYGGTAYQNTGGLGVTWPVVAENSAAQVRVGHVTPVLPTGQGLLVVPVTRLYDAGTLLAPSAEKLLGARIPAPRLEINSADAARLGLADGAEVSVRLAGRELRVALEVDGTAPPGAALLPRGLAGIGELRGPGLLVAQSEKAER